MRRPPVLFALLVLLLAAAGASPTQAAGGPPDLVLRGAVRLADLHHYIEVPFTVPAGIERLTVEFSQDGAAARTTIDLGLLDPQRFRGWSGGNKSSFTVGEIDATPSYLPGPLPAGRWRLLLGVPNIRPGVVTHYQARIHFTRRGEAAPVSSFSPVPLRAGPGWYRGDLHDHNAHSDGQCPSRSGRKVPCPPFLTLDAADRRGLDFIAVTDHNTVSQFDALRALQPYFDRTLIIPGRELTTFEGHANAWGVMDFIDFRLDGQHVKSADQMIAAVHRSGGLFSINHPGSPSGENCMGCGWTARVADPSQIDAVEVINGGALRETGQADGALQGFAFWQALLDKGLHPTAVGGSDNHNATFPPSLPGSIGAPTTVVFARELSERAILDGIKAGHVFIDIKGSADRRLELETDGPHGPAMMGDRVELAAGASAEVRLHVTGVPGGRVQLVHDAELKADADPAAPLGPDDRRSVKIVAGGGHHWLYVKILDAEGRLALVSNPLYFQGPAK